MLSAAGPSPAAAPPERRFPPCRDGRNGSWFDAAAFADLAAIADFNGDCYAISAIATSDIAAASAAALCRKRACSFGEWFAFSCASTEARSYADASGASRNDLAVDQPRFDWSRGRRQLALNDAATNLFLNSATAVSQSIAVSAQTYTVSFVGTGTLSWSGAASGSLAGIDTRQRVNQSFTPAAGAMNVGTSGDVRNVQIETGSVATAWIPTAGGAVTRAIENARFSPALEAILARAASSLIVKGLAVQRTSARLIGGAGSSTLLSWISNRRVINLSGATTLPSNDGPPITDSSWAVAAGWDSTGRSLIRSDTVLNSDTQTVSVISQAWLARNGNGSGSYGDGWYDWIGIAPARLPDLRMIELAVAA